MLIVVDAVGGHEVGVRTAQFLSRLVHQIHKSFDAPADMFADGVAAFVAGAHQKAIQRLLHGDSLPDLNADIGILAPVDAVDRFRRIFHHLVQGAFLSGYPGGEDLGGAGGIELLVDIFGVEDVPVLASMRMADLALTAGPCGQPSI